MCNLRTLFCSIPFLPVVTCRPWQFVWVCLKVWASKRMECCALVSFVHSVAAQRSSVDHLRIYLLIVDLREQ